LGRADKPLVIACVHELAAGNDNRRTWAEGCRDPRSLLTVEPLRYAVALRPRWIALEQVPAVLELWTMFAGLLSTHGYHTATGVLSAERYGVPQTRKRAFLIASLDGPVELPTPTHRSYNPRGKDGTEDEALLPWVSMADTGTYRKCDRRPSCNPTPTLTSGTRSWTRQPCVQVRRNGARIAEGFDPTTAPSQAVTTRIDRWQAHGVDLQDPVNGSLSEANSDWPSQRPAPTLVTTKRSKEGTLVDRQIPPGEGVEAGDWAWRNGNQPNTSIRASEEPAPTVHFGRRSNEVTWIPCTYGPRQRNTRPQPISKPAPTMLAATANGTPVWAGERPATTISCDRRIHPPGHKESANDPPGRYQQRRGANAVRVTVEQAAALQGFPADYPWQGARTRQFEQVGNAVPPPLAHRVLEQATKPTKRRPRAGRKKQL
jgi:DNA (cytosine-5)-methyltransferase 1